MTYLIEWSFNAFVISLFLFAVSCFIKNFRLKHKLYQIGFVLLLLLPLFTYLVKENFSPLFCFFELKSQMKMDTDLTVDPVLNTGEILLQTQSGFSFNQTGLLLLLTYLAAATLLFLKNYISLKKKCSRGVEIVHKLPEVKNRVIRSDISSTPFCFGFLKPLIIIPEDMVEEKEIQISIMHEKGHIENLDPQMACVQYFIKILYFWNPVIWFMNRKFNETQEILADHRAADDLGDAQVYAEILLNLVKRSRKNTIPVLTTGMASQKRQLLARLNAITKENENMKKSIPQWKKTSLIIAVGAASLLTLSSTLVGQEKERNSDKRINRTVDKTDANNKGKQSEKEQSEQRLRNGASDKKELEVRDDRQNDRNVRDDRRKELNGRDDRRNENNGLIPKEENLNPEAKRMRELVEKYEKAYLELRENADTNKDGKLSQSEKKAFQKKAIELGKAIEAERNN